MHENASDTDESRALGHEDIMSMLREARASGFAAQDKPDQGEFKTVDIWKSFDHFEGDPEPQQPHAVETSEPDLAQMVKERIGDPVNAPIPPDRDQSTDQDQEIAQTPDEPSLPDVETLKEAAYNEGFAQGVEMGKAQGYEEGLKAAQAEFDAKTQDGVAPMVELFETLTQQFLAASDRQAQTISAQIQTAVFDLASQRAGTEIDELPQAFIKRIETIAERILGSVESAIIRLNPDDLNAITPHLEASEIAISGRFVADQNLHRGDVQLKAGAIKLDDILAPKKSNP